MTYKFMVTAGQGVSPMDRTLFTPAMIDTFRACRRAYHLAFVKPQEGEAVALSAVCKRFLTKALAEINRGRIGNVQHVQKFLGQHWPSDKLTNDVDSKSQKKNIEAFRFVYRVLTQYIRRPYRPEKSEIAGIDLKVRARVPNCKVYLEDTFDLILWYPQTKHLEFVDYHLRPLKPIDPAWPAAAFLVKRFLAERLRSRWPFETVSLTFCQLQADGVKTNSFNLDEAVYDVHWPELLLTLEAMKDPKECLESKDHLCRRCEFLARVGMQQERTTSIVSEPISRSA